MAGAAAAALLDFGKFLFYDYLKDQGGSVYCRYLQIVDEGSGSFGFAAGGARALFCPPPPTPPPTNETFPSGGDPCVIYRATCEAVNNLTGARVVFDVDGPGPVRLNRVRESNAAGRYQGTDHVLFGIPGRCYVPPVLITGYDGITDEEGTGYILNIQRLSPGIDIEPPYRIIQPRPYPPGGDQQDLEINVEINGEEINIELKVGPIINTENGPVIQFEFPINPDIPIQMPIGGSPDIRLGLDINLQFAMELTGGGGSSRPAPGAQPLPLPPVPPRDYQPPDATDYEEIEDALEQASCCKSINTFINVGTRVFTTSSDVFNVDLPDGTIAVFLNVVQGSDTRVYRFAGDDSEYATGNASITVDDNVVDFVRLYVNNHAIYAPHGAQDLGVRLSCQRGTIVSITAGLYVEE